MKLESGIPRFLLDLREGRHDAPQLREEVGRPLDTTATSVDGYEDLEALSLQLLLVYAPADQAEVVLAVVERVVHGGDGAAPRRGG